MPCAARERLASSLGGLEQNWSKSGGMPVCALNKFDQSRCLPGQFYKKTDPSQVHADPDRLQAKRKQRNFQGRARLDPTQRSRCSLRLKPFRSSPDPAQAGYEAMPHPRPPSRPEGQLDLGKVESYVRPGPSEFDIYRDFIRTGSSLAILKTSRPKPHPRRSTAA